MADIEYKKNEDGTYAAWAKSQDKLTTDRLKILQSQCVMNIEAITQISGLSKDAATVVARIVQQQEELMRNASFTWAEIVAKYQAPIQANLDSINAALKSDG